MMSRVVLIHRRSTLDLFPLISLPLLMTSPPFPPIPPLNLPSLPFPSVPSSFSHPLPPSPPLPVRAWATVTCSEPCRGDWRWCSDTEGRYECLCEAKGTNAPSAIPACRHPASVHPCIEVMHEELMHDALMHEPMMHEAMMHEASMHEAMMHEESMHEAEKSTSLSIERCIPLILSYFHPPLPPLPSGSLSSPLPSPPPPAGPLGRAQRAAARPVL